MRTRLEELQERKRLLAQVVAQKRAKLCELRLDVESETRQLRAAEAEFRTTAGKLKAYQDSHPPMRSMAGGTY